MFFHKTRNFAYSIPKLSISEASITIKSNQCKTVEDLKEKIAEDLFIDKKQLQFENVPNKQIKNIDDNYDFKLKISIDQPDVELLIPGNKKVLIKDCYAKQFNEIFPYLAENGNYYSRSCIENNVALYLNGIIITKRKFPFLSSNDHSKFQLGLINKTVTLNFLNNQFTLSENEDSSEAIKLIQKVFQAYYIKIFDLNGDQPKTIKSSVSYSIKAECWLKFKNYGYCNSSPVYIYADLFETTSNVYINLAQKLSDDSQRINPENLILYDSKYNQIPNSNKQLRSYNDFEYDFYYKINLNTKSKPIKNYVEHSPKPKPSPVKYMPNKSFFYSIPEISIIKHIIEVNPNECKTISDLKDVIAFKLHLSSKQLVFKNVPNNELKYIDDYFNFQIELKSFYPDIDIYFGNIKVRIFDCYKKKISEIFDSLEESRIYFSDICIKNNVIIYLSGKHVFTDGYPFVSINQKSILELKLVGKTISLKYGKFIFTFADSEPISQASKLISKAFPNKTISIKDFSGSNDVYFLKSEEKYSLRIETFVTFENIYNSSFAFCHIDYFDTVFDAQILLANELKSRAIIRPEDIIICDVHQNAINDKHIPLYRIQKLNEKFYFLIEEKEFSYSPTTKYDSKDELKQSIDIIFLFIGPYRKKYKPFTHKIPINVKIAAIERKISNKYNISDKIVLKYKLVHSFQPLHKDNSIKDIRFLIRDNSNGIEEYFIYIDSENEEEKEDSIDLKPKYDDKTLIILASKFIPSGKTILIENCNSKTFYDFIYSFKKEGIYFSKECIINNLQLFHFDKQISKDGYPFLSIPAYTFIEVKFIKEIVTINYSNYHFIFSEYEPISVLKNLISKVITSGNIKILNESGDTPLLLSSKEKYQLQIIEDIKFINIDDSNIFLINVDYLNGIEFVQKELSEKLKYKYGQIKPENIMIYDHCKKPIFNFSKPLNCIQSLERPFYFKIDKIINMTPVPAAKRSPNYKIKVKKVPSKNESSDDEISKKPVAIVSKSTTKSTINTKNPLIHDDPIKKPRKSSEIRTPEKEDLPKVELNCKKVEPKRRSNSISRFKPKITPNLTSEIKESNLYKFEFKGELKKIRIQDDFTIKSQEERIKKEFNISSEESLLFKFLSDKGKQISITDTNAKILSFKFGTIQIYIQEKIKSISQKNNKKEPLQFLKLEDIEDFEKIKEMKNDDIEIIYEVISKANHDKHYILKTLKEKIFDKFKVFFQEHELLHNFNHPSILKTYGIFLGDTENSVSIVFEYYINNLNEYIKEHNLNNVNKFKLIYEIAEGMRYVHSRNIIHRELNPLNIFIVDKERATIGGFGISQMFTANEQLTFSRSNAFGIIQYIAPELVDHYDEKVDVYSFAMLMLFIINNGHLPKFNKKQSINEILNNIEKPAKLTEYSIDLIEKCLSTNPKDRPNFNMIVNELDLNYINFINMNKDEEETIQNFIKYYKSIVPDYSH